MESLHPFNPQVPYNNYGAYLKNKFGQRVYRIGVDPGFSCPNRDQDRTQGGCRFCAGEGAASPYVRENPSLAQQIRKSKEALRAKAGDPAILYFQAYTSTYAPVDLFQKKLLEALGEGPFKQLIISTRPDCLGDEYLDVLEDLRDRVEDVWIELGLQSLCEETLAQMNRGHGVKEFINAVHRASSRGFLLAPHLIFGFPGEGPEFRKESILRLRELPLAGIKIHNLMVIKETPLYKDYLEGKVPVYGGDEHLEACMEALELMPPHWVILRLTADYPGPVENLAWDFGDKQEFLVKLRKRMVKEGRWQGKRTGHF